MKSTAWYAIVWVCLLFSCQPKEAIEITNDFPPLFPDYTFVTVPYTIAPLNFGIKDAIYMRADVTAGDRTLSVITGKDHLRFPEKKWKQWLEQQKNNSITLTVSAWTAQHPEGIRYAPFTIAISENTIDEWIAYRLIEPGYELWNRMGIYQRDLTSFTEEPVFTNRQNNDGCVNCHSFLNYSPDDWMFHSRGINGKTMLIKNGQIQGIDLPSLENGRSGTYPMWHPSGKYIVFSSNDTQQSFYHFGKMPVEVYDISSHLFIYDTVNNRIITDGRFTDENYFDTFPAFSPDGMYLYFCRAESRKMPAEYKDLHYGLYRVPFDAETGKPGEEIETIYDPSITGGSVSFPRISPDGQYLLYTEADCATFPIWHKEADMRMIRLTDHQSMDTDALNSPEAESYHSWSSNGQWVLFSSRRIDGRYTRLYISAINEKGEFSKPFLLPQKNPWHNTWRLQSYNIPEFVNKKISGLFTTHTKK